MPVEEPIEYPVYPEGSNTICRLRGHHTSTMRRVCSTKDHLSQRQQDRALSNVHKVHLGPGGYQRKVNQWRREREAAIAVGQPDPYEGLDEHARRWLQARKPKIVEGKPKFDRPEIEAVTERMLKLAELQKKG